MSENLLYENLSMPPEDVVSSQTPSLDEPVGIVRPSNIPEKFWDKEQGQLRTDALVKSYLELEQRLGSGIEQSLPDNPNDYNINVQNDLFQVDPDINTRLHSAGFSQKQAQLVYDLASEKLIPLVNEVASMFEAEKQIDRLVQFFGSEDRWRESSRQISAWGHSNLPSEVFEALSKTHDGIVTMHQMMSNKEPGLIREGTTATGTISEGELKQMMRDPRYWRDQDPSFVNKVREGFQRLFPE